MGWSQRLPALLKTPQPTATISRSQIARESASSLTRYNPGEENCRELRGSSAFLFEFQPYLPSNLGDP